MDGLLTFLVVPKLTNFLVQTGRLSKPFNSRLRLRTVYISREVARRFGFSSARMMDATETFGNKL